MSDPNTETQPGTPAEVIERFSACLNSGDLDGALVLYLPDAVFQAAPDDDPISGRESIRRALASFLALGPTMTGELQKVHQAGDTALVVNRWRLDGTRPDGEALQMSGTSADVMRRREDGSWGILVDDPWAGAASDRRV
jgi:uncharacterized protein (TIGR02246 family)